MAERAEMAVWKDKTTYTRDQVVAADRTPRILSVNLGGVQLSVHRHIHHGPDVWLASCTPQFFCQVQLKSADIEEAKAEAITLLRKHVEKAFCALPVEATPRRDTMASIIAAQIEGGGHSRQD